MPTTAMESDCQVVVSAESPFVTFFLGESESTLGSVHDAMVISPPKHPYLKSVLLNCREVENSLLRECYHCNSTCEDCHGPLHVVHE